MIRSPMQPSDARSWWVSLVVLCAILGALLGLSFKTQNRLRAADLPASNYPALAQEYKILKGKVLDYQGTIAHLQKDATKLVNSTASDTQQTRVLADQLNQARFVAGLTDVQGPGVVVTLNDSKRRFPNMLPQMQEALMVHDNDINRAVNELKAAKAEAVSVNGQRVVATTAIRCAGPTVFVNDTPQTPPYVIKAIGDPKTLQDALNLPDGVAEQLRNTDPAMIKIAQAKRMTIPAYAGATQFKYALPVTPAPGAVKEARG